MHHMLHDHHENEGKLSLLRQVNLLLLKYTNPNHHHHLYNAIQYCRCHETTVRQCQLCRAMAQYNKTPIEPTTLRVLPLWRCALMRQVAASTIISRRVASHPILSYCIDEDSRLDFRLTVQFYSTQLNCFHNHNFLK